MSTELDLGPVPADEKCEQAGPDYDVSKALKECRVYISQLFRQFGPAPTGVRFKITSNPHEFGTYHDVAIVIADDAPEGSFEWAYHVESNCPSNWDDEAREALGL